MAFDNIKLEKGLYTTGKSFTQALEELDPSENYAGTALEGLDAYERQLKRFDIKVSGINSDPVAKFFATTDSAALFPEYVSRAVKLGIDSNNSAGDIVATTTQIDSLDYRSIFCQDMDFSLEEVEEGAALPEVTISLSDKLTELKKHGRMLVASYEAIKYQKLDLFTTMLKKIGDSIAASEFYQAVMTVSSGELSTENFEMDGTAITYNQLIQFWASFLPYKLNTVIASKKMLTNILCIPEISDSIKGNEFKSSGEIVSPLGIKFFSFGSDSDNTMVGIDKNYALEKVQAGGVITEFDKLIDRQLERATISTIVGYSVLYEDAIKVLLMKEN